MMMAFQSLPPPLQLRGYVPGHCGFGRLLGTLIALVGIGFFALPAGILASGFAEEIERNQEEVVLPALREGPARERRGPRLLGRPGLGGTILGATFRVQGA